MVTLDVAILVLSFLVISFFPTKIKLCAAAIASIFQLYFIKIGNLDISLSLFFSLSLLPAFIKNAKTMFRVEVMLLFIAIVTIQTLSIFWSSDRVFGLKTIIWLISFLFLLVAVYSLGIDSIEMVENILLIMMILLSMQAFSVMLFRVSPVIENIYWNSRIVGFFIEPDTIKGLLDNSIRNNVLDNSKSGGLFFINSNIAATYLGMSALLLYGLAKLKHKYLLIIIALVLWVSVFFTGSKAGSVLAICLPIIGWLISNSRYKVLAIGVTAIMLVEVVNLVMLLGFSDIRLIDLVNDFSKTLLIREKIWNYGLLAFMQSPLLGQGFGGWAAGYSSYAVRMGISQAFPPHNTFIFLWSQSGVIAMFLGFLFMIAVVKISIKSYFSGKISIFTWGVCFGLASLWLFIQGMGENFGIVGEMHILVLFAISLGYSLLRNKQLDELNHEI